MRQYFIDCTKGPSALIYIINNNVCVMRVFPSLCNSSSRMCVVGTSINHGEFFWPFFTPLPILLNKTLW